MSLDNVKFRRPVRPGDQLRFELEMLQVRGPMCRDARASRRWTARSCARRRWPPWCATNERAHPSDRDRRPDGRARRRTSEIGPFAIVGPGCVVGAGCVIEAARHAPERNVRLGARRAASAIGSDARRRAAGPQVHGRGDARWRSATDTVIREYVTINRGTVAVVQDDGGRELLPDVVRAPRARLPRRRRRDHVERHPARRPRHDRGLRDHLAASCAVHQFATIGASRVHRRHVARGEGRAAVREGGRQPDQAVRPEQRRPAAPRVQRGGRRASSSAPIGCSSTRS